MISKKADKKTIKQQSRGCSRSETASHTWKSGTVLSNMSIDLELSKSRMLALAPALTSILRSNSKEPESSGVAPRLTRLSSFVDVELSTLVPFAAIIEELDTLVEFPPIGDVEFEGAFSLFIEAETEALRSSARSASRNI